jgi:hypothetical protein
VETPNRMGRQWIIVTPLAALRAIGDPCAETRWQDHHKDVVVFLFASPHTSLRRCLL